ncbi:hypothetical protein FQR65_LT18905 [Abscondita terminalis]|nr:hypothetical protein FQR65_LT18905 [Abscondita terminalis]
MSTKCSDADMGLFLDLYKNHQCLWNTKENIYRNTQARSAALESIIVNMGKPDLTENSEFTQNEEADYFGNDGTLENSERSVENDTQNENLAIVNVQQTPNRTARVEGGVRQPKKTRTIEPIQKAINKLESIVQINNATKASDEFE